MKEKSYRSNAVFYLNGRRQEVGGSTAGMMLADYLRFDQRLTGTKIVCAEGDCGACSVLRLFRGAGQKASTYQAINSCITTVAQMDGSSLVTVDYLAKEKLDAVQESMVNYHGSQCGFCTPGFVVALKGLVEKRNGQAKKGAVSLSEAKNALTGNLCRCTGYQQILDAALALQTESARPLKKEPWHRDMENELVAVCKKPLRIETEDFSFYAPVNPKEAAAYLFKFSDAKVIGAGTDLCVYVNKQKATYKRLISLHLISGLYKLEKKGKRVRVGSRVTLEDLRVGLKGWIPQFSSYLDIFASPQIKNVATLVGNLCNASPIGDTLPFLLAMNATVYTVGKTGTRKIDIDKYFLGYRETALKKGEIVTAIEFDIPAKSESLYLYKTSQRKDLDISAVNGAIRIGDEVRVAIGGVAAIPRRFKTIETLLTGKGIDPFTLEESIGVLQNEIKPISDVRGSSTFRRVLAKNFLKSSLEKEIQRSEN